MKINDIHISQWNATLLTDSFGELLSFPALKLPYKNDWAEENGTEYDLEAPVWGTSEVVLKFYVPAGHYGTFTEVMSRKVHNDYTFETLQKTYSLRLSSITIDKALADGIFFNVKLVNDRPFYGYTYVMPQLSTNDTGTLLDGKNIASYGVRLLQGSREKILSKGEIKAPLQLQNNAMKGVKVDADAPMVYKEKVVKLKCNIHQPIADFFAGYEAFFYDLTRSGEHSLTYEGTPYTCIYKDSKVTATLIDERSAWVDFDLDLIFV